MREARWSIYLLKKGSQPLLYFKGMKEPWTRERLQQSASKVFDGSDADAMILVREDKHPSEYNSHTLSIQFARDDDEK